MNNGHVGVYLGDCALIGVGRQVWRVKDEFSFWSITGPVVTVEADFLTDCASVPRPLWALIPASDGQYDPAAVVHDKAVRCRKLLKLRLTDCHRLFLEALLARRVPAWKARLMFGAVYACNWMFAGKGDGTTPRSLLRRVDVINLRGEP